MTPEAEAIYISHSAIQSWKRCRRYYWFSSKFHRNLRPLEDNENLVFGSNFHETLAIFWEKMKVTFPLMEAQADPTFGVKYASAEAKELATGMMESYMSWVDHSRWSKPPLAVEYPFAIQIAEWEGKPVYYHGIIDLVLQDEDEIIVVDHKTCSSFKSGSGIDKDEQITGYLWAMRELGHKVGRAFYDEIRKVAPAKPKRLASGKLSTDKRNLVLYDEVVESLEDGEIEEYEEYLEYLLDRPSPFVRRAETYRSDYALDRYGKQLAVEAQEMLSTANFFPSPSWFSCNSCAFSEPCQAMNDGNDWEFMLEELYTQRAKAEIVWGE